MEILEAITGRRSCRSFSDKSVENEKILAMLSAANFAPSPANKKPWEFIVVSHSQYQEKIKQMSEKVKQNLLTKVDIKWLNQYDLAFLTQCPVLVIVVGDPAKSGIEEYLDDPSPSYIFACCAAIQNMLLRAQSLGLGSLWFSLFEKQDIRDIFDIPNSKDPIGIVCIGYSEGRSIVPKQKTLEDKVRYIGMKIK